jgi:K+-transporting ATPase ATPase C chain
MKKNLSIAILFTVVTTFIFGIVYPLGITAMAQLLFPQKANGQLIEKDGKIIGSRIIGQSFAGRGYFHSRPSAAGKGYDPTASGGSNLGPTSKMLTDRVSGDVKTLQSENGGSAVPIDLVTASGSGLDPHISPAAAEYQVERVAHEREMTVASVQSAVARHTQGRQFGLFGEARVNALELNLDLDGTNPIR